MVVADVDRPRGRSAGDDGQGLHVHAGWEQESVHPCLHGTAIAAEAAAAVGDEPDPPTIAGAQLQLHI